MHVEETLAAKELGEEVQVHVRPEGERADDLLPPGTMESTACRCGPPCDRACVGVTSWRIARRTSEGLREYRTRSIAGEVHNQVDRRYTVVVRYGLWLSSPAQLATQGRKTEGPMVKQQCELQHSSEVLLPEKA